MTQVRTKKPTKAKTADVIALLKADHKKVKDLFDKFEGIQDKKGSEQKKKEIVEQICHELTLHALAEEAIVYPEARKSIEDEELMDEADVEHAGAKELIAQLQTMNPTDSHFNAKVTVLREYIEHHVAEEESEMLPKLKDSGADREALAKELIQFKEEHEEEVKTTPTSIDESAASVSRHKQVITQRDPASDLPTDPIRHSSHDRKEKSSRNDEKDRDLSKSGSSSTQGGTSEQHAKAGSQSHKKK